MVECQHPEFATLFNDSRLRRFNGRLATGSWLDYGMFLRTS